MWLSVVKSTYVKMEIKSFNVFNFLKNVSLVTNLNKKEVMINWHLYKITK